MNQRLSESARKIIQCCRQGDVDQLQKLLNSGVDINDVSHGDFVPLNTALKHGRWKIARYLLQQNAVPGHADQPALIAATQYPKDMTTGIELIFRHTGNLDVTDKNGRTALMTACLLGHEKKVKFLLQDTDNIQARDEMGMSAFLDAIISQSPSIVETLIARGVDVHETNLEGDNALMIAIQTPTPNIKVIKRLLEEDVDCCHKNQHGRTAFDVAARKHPHIQKLFVTKLEADKQLELPLFDTGEKQSIDENPRPTKAVPQDKNTPKASAFPTEAWFSAVSGGNLGKLNQLRMKGTPIDVTDDKGCTALIHAAGKGLRAVASYLLQNGASPEHRSKNGSTALSSAIISNSRAVVGLLLNHGADPCKTGPGGYPYASLAAAQWNEDCLSLLLQSGASINTTDAHGMSLFHHVAIAAEYYVQTARAKGTMRLLAQNQLDINQINQQGNTCLHVLCGAHKTSYHLDDDSHLANIVHEALKLGANPKATNHQGFTALQYAKKHRLLNTKGVILSVLDAW
ncbi:ankyrin repeat domain-containing protein [Marinicella sediminis]|uniref:Ankyrin repeat domain-containing protein n=1 Tax=Marinicella sediminis TaxID=1792834 RepID=A0ABV7JBM4_9GAMM|nr:ankyrin repeat domain-containing protein [Marinicella sediminis]